MKERIAQLVDEKIKYLNVYVSDVYITNEEGQKTFNIALNSSDYIDLNKVTEASKIINEILDKEKALPLDIDVLDIFSQEKGDGENER